jgi:hypothetical protein
MRPRPSGNQFFLKSAEESPTVSLELEVARWYAPEHNAVIVEIADWRSGGEMSIPQRTGADRVFRLPGLCLAWLATISAFRLAFADDQIPVGFKNLYSHLWARNPFTLAARATSQAQPGAFDKLVLVNWQKDAGKDVIFVQNTETNDNQKITTEPNKNNIRAEIHPNDNPKLVEAVISNGSEKEAVKFPFEVPPAANRPKAPVPLGMGVPGQAPPGAVPQNGQNPQFNLPGAPNPNSLQGAYHGQMSQAGAPAAQPQNPRMRPAETRRKRILAAPGSGQPLATPGSGQPTQN